MSSIGIDPEAFKKRYARSFKRLVPTDYG